MKINHLIISRASFDDKELFKTYLTITKEILVPCLRSQINKNFNWGLLIKSEDVNFVKEYLNIDFIPFSNKKEIIEYIKNNTINIQTRHDIDDYMSEMYIEKIQQIYNENINKYDKFLIQAQPVRLNYNSKEELKMSSYTDTKNSMFLTLCQKNNENYIFDKKHGEMYKIAKHVITLPEGYTKWVIHGNNISCRRKNKIKYEE